MRRGGATKSIAPGHLCWAELATADQPAAKRFYGELLGWRANDVPIGPTEVYSIMQLGGRDAGAIYTTRAEERAQGIPPHWNLYVAVASADEAASKAAALGGKLLAPPFDVMDQGRMAVLQDPTGAVINLWQPGKHGGFGVTAEPAAYSWAELDTRDVPGAQKFYTALFGWTVAGSPQYYQWKAGDQDIGGLMEIGASWGPVPPNWLIYFQVEDCRGDVASAERMGARVLVPTQEIPGRGRFAALADPQGAAFALYESD